MSGRKRFAALLVAVLAGLLALVAGAASSQAAPGYTEAASISFNSSGTCAGQLAVNGTGFAGGEQVTLTLDATTLTALATDASGSFSADVTLPAGVSGNHQIVATGSTGDSASGSITIGDCGNGTAPETGTGGLSNTGVAVLSLAGLGLVLLVGGIFLVASGRRRRTLI
jgi:hypothetical protein